MSKTTKTFSTLALCLRPDSTQFAVPTATQPCSPTCFRRLAWRWRREYRWPLDSNYTASWKSSFLPLGYSAGNFNVNHLSSEAILPLCFFPSNSLLCFSSFPSILNCQLSWASDHTLTDLCISSPEEKSGGTCRFQCVIFLYALGPAYTAAPLLCPSWQQSSAKHWELKSRSKYVEAEARLPTERSPTPKHPSITDKDIPHL